MPFIETQSMGAEIRADQVTLHGQLHLPPDVRGLVIFVHGSGGSRHGPRNQRIADFVHDIGIGTLQFDLLSPGEAPADTFNARLSIDPPMLARRLRAATRWVRDQPEIADVPIGYFGAGTGAAAAILAATTEAANISAVVSCAGRTDLANDAIPRLRAPTLLVVGGNDTAVVALNMEVWVRLRCEKAIEIIPGTGHLFEEPGALENVAALAARWFGEHLRKEDDFLE